MLRSIAITLMAGGLLFAQTEKLEFTVASVKQNKSDDNANSNFPLGAGAVYAPNGGLFNATGYPLVTYIAFAYKLVANDMQFLLSQLPAWATTDRYDIQARAKGNPSKDQMRLMMRTLLADRFKLAIHYDPREVPVSALVLIKPDKLGPQIQPHTGDASCPTDDSADAPNPPFVNGLPVLCGGIFGTPPSVPGRLRAAARNVSLSLFATSLSGVANLGRPILDRTGLTGLFDFSFEWTPEPTGLPPGADLVPDESGPTFIQALKEQFGMKLESTKGRVDVFMVDHVERPSAN